MFLNDKQCVEARVDLFYDVAIGKSVLSFCSDSPQILFKNTTALIGFGAQSCLSFVMSIFRSVNSGLLSSTVRRTAYWVEDSAE